MKTDSWNDFNGVKMRLFGTDVTVDSRKEVILSQSTHEVSPRLRVIISMLQVNKTISRTKECYHKMQCLFLNDWFECNLDWLKARLCDNLLRVSISMLQVNKTISRTKECHHKMRFLFLNDWFESNFGLIDCERGCVTSIILASLTCLWKDACKTEQVTHDLLKKF